MSGVSSSIQFRGMNEVLDAYEARAVDAWSLWQGKQFMTKGIEGESLKTFIAALCKAGSTAIYTLKVFEDVTDIKQIKSSTDHDGSFNFRLFERDEESVGGGSYRSPGSLSYRFEQLEERMNKFFEKVEEEDPEEEEEKNDVLGTITGLLQDPDKLEKLINLGRSLLGSPQPSYTLGNVSRAGGDTGQQGGPSLSPSNITPEKIADPEDRLNRLGVAIDTLEKQDPLLVEHMEKLAKISTDSPRQFLQLISMLDVI